MRKTVRRCLLTCLVFVLVMAANVPVWAKTSKKSKVAMPKTAKVSYVDEKGEISPYNSTEYSISYDKEGRIKKISGLSKATDGRWTYTISYKKSGKNTKATIKYEPDWGEDPEKYTYKFDSNGRLVSSKKSSKCKWNFDEDLILLGAENDYLVFFDKTGNPEMIYYLSGEKVISIALYDFKNGKLNERTSVYFGKEVELEAITEDFLAEYEPSSSVYEIKTSKVSMTNAVKWMNTVLLLDFVYRG